MRMLAAAFISFIAAAAAAKTDEIPKDALAASCCKCLQDAPELDGNVHLPGSATYNARLSSYWSVSAGLPSWCIVLPRSSEHVSIIIKTLSKNQCNFGIRGGGHGAFPLANSVEHGVTIDFGEQMLPNTYGGALLIRAWKGKMTTTTWNTETKIASIQPGTHWQAVYETLAPLGVVVPGGRVSTVGVGGYLTGGGISFHQASHGLACDNVVNFEVVLASGEIVNANASSYPDLWQALKGSSGNLGLVTRFDMNGIEYKNPAKPLMWGGNVAFKESSKDAIVEAVVSFTDNVHKDENSSVILVWTYNPEISPEPMINAAMYNTEAQAKPSAFDGFFSADGIQSDMTRITDMTELTAELGFGQVAGFYYVWYTSAFQSDARPVKYAVEKFAELNKELEKVAPSSKSRLNTNLFFQPLSKSMTDKGTQNGGNVIGLERFTAHANGLVLLVTASVKDAESERLIVPKLAKFMDDVDAYSASLRLKWDWRYLNYARGDQDAIASYGALSIGKIRAAANKYDPKGVFQNLRASGFKIPEDFTKTEL
ncbi:hypothetical protein NLG97_g454 [Lecanicillium saksenae]|uniref:Uncharacterized protein n=1 Tax=Lecanicillium saksenae TaxID=468837 RepID=A0ACC1R757_9HYPO|nr:hypothetical protein NLG97_g454 [Lecanicillium saksenae]